MRKGSSVVPQRQLWRVLALLAVIAPGVLGVQSVSAQCMYEIVAEISTPGCPPFDLAPMGVTAMNDHGVVVGSYLGCNIDNRLPFMWSQEMGFVPIPLPPGVPSAEPMDINNNGEIVGFMNPSGATPDRAFHWKDGVWTELPSLPGSTNTFAYAISEDGIIVGESSNLVTGPAVACIWEDGKISAMELPSGPNSAAFGVSDHLSVVGRMGGSPTPFVPFLWTPESTTAIPTLDGAFRSEALAVNERDQVTGQSLIDVKQGSVPRRSWVFEDGILTDLGVLPDSDHRVIVRDINDAGQIVGRAEGVEVATYTAFLWQQSQIIELESLVANPPDFLWLGGASAINNHGLIAAPNQALGGWLILAPADRPVGDVNIDCIVDAVDLALVLDDWGPDKLGHLTDIVTNSTFQPPGDGMVDGADLAVVLGNWSISSSHSSRQRSK